MKRRLEVRGTVNDITIYDDFAHHPTAIETTIAGLRSKVKDARILAVLEPRSNTMKMGVMKEALAGSLAEADLVFCYTKGLGWDAARALTSLGAKSACFDDLGKLRDAIAAACRPGDHVLVMSNGGFGGIHTLLLEALKGASRFDPEAFRDEAVHRAALPHRIAQAAVHGPCLQRVGVQSWSTLFSVASLRSYPLKQHPSPSADRRMVRTGGSLFSNQPHCTGSSVAATGDPTGKASPVPPSAIARVTSCPPAARERPRRPRIARTIHFLIIELLLIVVPVESGTSRAYRFAIAVPQTGIAESRRRQRRRPLERPAAAVFCAPCGRRAQYRGRPLPPTS